MKEDIEKNNQSILVKLKKVKFQGIIMQQMMNQKMVFIEMLMETE